jgi:hypothetical protein
MAFILSPPGQLERGVVRHTECSDLWGGLSSPRTRFQRVQRRHECRRSTQECGARGACRNETFCADMLWARWSRGPRCSGMTSEKPFIPTGSECVRHKQAPRTTSGRVEISLT